MTDARINIIADDNQVDALVQSMNNLQESLQSVVASMNQTQTEARQTGNAIQGASRQTQTASNNIRQSATGGSSALAGMGGSAIRAAGGLRGIAAASAAAAGPLIAAVASIEALKAALTGTVNAITAYLEKSPQLNAQLNLLKQAGTDLQTAFGGFAFELLGGTDLLETLIDVAETGADIFESLAEQVSGAGDQITLASIAIDLFRIAASAVYAVVVAFSAAAATLGNALNFVIDLDFSRFQERQREINRTFREQSLEVWNLAAGLNEVRRTGDAGALDINLNTVSGGAGGISEGDRQIISAIEALERSGEETREELVTALGILKPQAQEAVQAQLFTGLDQMILRSAENLGLDRDAMMQGMANAVSDKTQGYLYRFMAFIAEIARASETLEQRSEDLQRLRPIAAAANREAEQALAASLAAREEEAELLQRQATAQQTLNNAQRRLQGAGRIPTVPDLLGSAATGGAIGGGTVGGVGATGAVVGLGRRLVQNVPILIRAAGPGSLGSYASAVGRNLPTMVRGVAGPAARTAVGGPIGATAMVAGGLGIPALRYNRASNQRVQALDDQFEAMVALGEAQSNLVGIEENLQNLRANELATANTAIERARELNALQRQYQREIAAANELLGDGAAIEAASEQQRRTQLQLEQEINADRKSSIGEINAALERERQYFDFIQEAILGTKEETRNFLDLIQTAETFEGLFRDPFEAGEAPEAVRGIAGVAVMGEEGFSQIGNIGFEDLSRDLDLELQNFRSIAADDTFPSVNLMLLAIGDTLTDQEKAWAAINGGIGEYLKAIERSKEATRDAFKQDAIDGFTSSIENIGSFLGQTLAQSFDDGLTGAERAKALLAGMLGDFLTTIGSTAIAQGAIIAFGDPLAGGLPNPARAAGLIAAGTAAVIAGSALSGVASNIQSSGANAGAGGGVGATPGVAGAAQSTTNVFIENRFGNRFDARELDRSANETFTRAAQAGQ